jgi:hypothetical protein
MCSVWTNHSVRLLQLSLVISVSINTYIVSLGFGRHIETISPEDLRTINLNTIMVACFGIIATTTGKTSFAITLYRITANQWVKYFLIFVIITVSMPKTIHILPACTKTLRRSTSP